MGHGGMSVLIRLRTKRDVDVLLKRYQELSLGEPVSVNYEEKAVYFRFRDKEAMRRGFEVFKQIVFNAPT